MITIRIEFKKVEGKNPVLPEYATTGSSGADIRACLDEPLILQPGETAAVSTGWMIAVPQGYEAQIRPRSGLALHHQIILPNSPGTIDADYRGEVKILLSNLGTEPFMIKNGDRVAQMVICPVISGEFLIVDELPDTERGAGGFGHSGTD
ncbi:dUTP diphosphatase [bacterium]|nr:dUTP diphosphatase [bacterium]